MYRIYKIVLIPSSLFMSTYVKGWAYMLKDVKIWAIIWKSRFFFISLQRNSKQRLATYLGKPK